MSTKFSMMFGETDRTDKGMAHSESASSCGFGELWQPDQAEKEINFEK